MTIWFSSDLHFYHTRVIEYCERPYSGVDEMHDALIENWNQCVKPTDSAYLLGDICFGGTARKKILSRLCGKITAVLGNHDDSRARVWEALGWAVLPPCQLVIEGQPFLLSHYPFRTERVDERYPERCFEDDGRSWLLHGHVHQHWKQRGRQINVGCDVWHYRPAELREIMAIVTCGDGGGSRG